MAVDVLMPVISSAGEAAVVTAWFVDDGQACAAGQLIAEVQAEKVSEEIEAPESGYVVDRVALGDPVRQGERVCSIVESVEFPEGASRPPATEPVAPASAVRASPAAKRLARDLGVDLSGLVGTGPGGRITEGDVQAAGSAPAMSGLRAVIARNLRRSHAETVPVTLTTTVRLGESVPSDLTARVVKATAMVLADHPLLNGTRDGDAYRPAASAGIALAMQTEEGLVTPVVRDAAERSIEELTVSIRELADRARSRQLSAADYEGGTFTVTNLGSYGIEGFTPAINLPHVGILGVGVARRVPIVGRSGEILLGREMVLSLTFDHAFIDGAPAAAFLQQLREALEA
jgi:pyruvate dehydrogenase E2 component (dihydrolipoamide acetyltransferase)